MSLDERFFAILYTASVYPMVSMVICGVIFLRSKEGFQRIMGKAVLYYAALVCMYGLIYFVTLFMEANLILVFIAVVLFACITGGVVIALRVKEIRGTAGDVFIGFLVFMGVTAIIYFMMAEGIFEAAWMFVLLAVNPFICIAAGVVIGFKTKGAVRLAAVNAAASGVVFCIVFKLATAAFNRLENDYEMFRECNAAIGYFIAEEGKQYGERGRYVELEKLRVEAREYRDLDKYCSGTEIDIKDDGRDYEIKTNLKGVPGCVISYSPKESKLKMDRETFEKCRRGQRF
ncbi:MAG TPA: hypothetical protein PLQ76_02925 [bacterium]|nr:hypothetical protein [bacterium]